MEPGQPTSPTDVPTDVLGTPVTELNGVGPSRAVQLQAVGVNTLGELLHYFPRDYQYISAQSTIAELAENTIATASGEVVAVDYISGPRPRFEATLQDSTGKLALTFFHGAYLRSKIFPGLQLKVTGKLRFFRNMPQMQNPKWSVVDGPTPLGVVPAVAGYARRVEGPLPDAAPPPPVRPGDVPEGQGAPATLHPLYPASGRLTSDVLAKIVKENLTTALGAVREILPPGLVSRRELLSRVDAYRLIHRPHDKTDALAARRRLVYDELFIMQMGLMLSRQKHDGKLSAPILRCDRVVDERIRKRFPFEMTRAQTNATYEILRDLSAGRAMNRLLQGDVGSGKTAVALYVMLVAVANKMQAALLAPTEVLAEQHYLTLSRFMADSAVTVELFTSRTKKASKGALKRQLEAGGIHIAVGTQALLQEDMAFANLGLVVVDEQHRLGVKQRATLRGKGMAPHYLVMTATPIPRTLALSYFADFDLSVIDELPPGREPVDTRWVKKRNEIKAWEFLRKQILGGHQAYIVVPRIGDDDVGGEGVSGDDDTTSLLKEFKRLNEGPLLGLRLVMLHGKMPPEEKQEVMRKFREKEADVLVATTVIEVGVDVPNATVIAIMDAERFGLSQLHQLRGRVGRGGNQSYCLLFSEAAEGGGAGPGGGELAAARLTALTQTHSGFEIAELDLRLRGPGQFFGTRQHGLPEFRLADLSQESDLLHDAREDAQWLVERDPQLRGAEVRQLRAEIQKQFADALPLASVG